MSQENMDLALALADAFNREGKTVRLDYYYSSRDEALEAVGLSD
jgi:hypothetical protein